MSDKPSAKAEATTSLYSFNLPRRIKEDGMLTVTSVTNYFELFLSLNFFIKSTRLSTSSGRMALYMEILTPPTDL